MSPEELRERQREHSLVYARSVDRHRILYLEHHQLAGQLKRQMHDCAQALSGQFPDVTQRTLLELCNDGNPFAIHLQSLERARNDNERRTLNPTFMRAVDEMTPPKIISIKDEGKAVKRSLDGVRYRRSVVGYYGEDARAPYISDRLVIPTDAFAAPLSPPTLALLVEQMLRENRSVERELTQIVHERLHANGLMTTREFLGALRSFAEALLLEAQTTSPDDETICIIWENAERMFFDAMPFLEEYSPVCSAGTGAISGLIARRPAASPITVYMDEILSTWRTLPALTEFACVGAVQLPQGQRVIEFAAPCTGRKEVNLADIEDDYAVAHYMKHMPLRVNFCEDNESGGQF